MARPTKMTKDVVQKLEDAFSRGLNDTEACLYAGIARQTLLNYEQSHEKFLDKKTRLRENVKMHAKLNLAEQIIDQKDVDLSLWYLERKCAGEFSKKSALEMSGAQEVKVLIPEAAKDLGQ